MRTMLAGLALAAAIAVGFAQTTNQSTTTGQGAQTTLTVVVKNDNLSYEDAAAAMAVARATNKDVAKVVSDRGSVSAPIYQEAPAFIISSQCGKSFSDVWAMYTGGQTWMQIASSCNVPASCWNPAGVDTANWTNDDFTKGVWQGVLMNSYGMTSDDFVSLTNTQQPMNEIVVAQVVAREDNTPIKDVIAAYQANQDWNSVEQKYALNQQNPPNQSQAGETSQTATQQTQTQTNTTQSSQTAQATQSTTQTTTNPSGGSETTTSVSTLHSTQTASKSPTEEWQVNGGDINPYNGWAEVQQTESSYAMHRASVPHHRRHRRHHRHHRRHHRVHHVAHMAVHHGTRMVKHAAGGTKP